MKKKWLIIVINVKRTYFNFFFLFQPCDRNESFILTNDDLKVIIFNCAKQALIILGRNIIFYKFVNSFIFLYFCLLKNYISVCWYLFKETKQITLFFSLILQQMLLWIIKYKYLYISLIFCFLIFFILVFFV